MAFILWDLDKRLNALAAAISVLDRKLDKIAAKEERLMATVQEVEAKVSEVTDAEDAVIKLLDEVHTLLVNSRTDPVALQKVIDDLESRKTALAAAVMRNTEAQ